MRCDIAACADGGEEHCRIERRHSRCFRCSIA
jgi:hypothetical protein